MAKVSGVVISEPWSPNLIFPIFKDACSALLFSYHTVYNERLKNPYVKPKDGKHWHLEDMITDDLTRDEEILPRKFDYRIVNQQKDVKKKTRIDIAILWSTKFGNAYDIKIECKLLNNANLDYIISRGINKFKSNQYSEKLSFAGMLFYNTSGCVEDNLNALNKKIESKLSCSEKMSNCKLIDNYNFTYKSNHSRELNCNIDLYSMVFDFRDVVLN